MPGVKSCGPNLDDGGVQTVEIEEQESEHLHVAAKVGEIVQFHSGTAQKTLGPGTPRAAKGRQRVAAIIVRDCILDAHRFRGAPIVTTKSNSARSGPSWAE